MDRVETVRSITDTEAADLAARTGRWTMFLHVDSSLHTLNPAVYASYAAWGADRDAEAEAAKVADPGSYGALIELLSPVDHQALSLLERLGVSPTITDTEP